MNDSTFNLCVPHNIGTFETGSLLPDTNNLILYVESTEKLIKYKEQCFERCFKYMCSKRFLGSDFDYYQSFTEMLHNGIGKDGVRFAGVYILNDVYQIVFRNAKNFFNEILKQYQLEIGENPIIDDSLEHIKKDFINYLFRQYEVWLARKQKKFKHLDKIFA